jgi:hypothetical protein
VPGLHVGFLVHPVRGGGVAGRWDGVEGMALRKTGGGDVSQDLNYLLTNEVRAGAGEGTTLYVSILRTSRL